MTEDRFTGALHVVIDPASCQQSKYVAVPPLNPILAVIEFGSRQQIGLILQCGEDVRTSVQRYLDTCSWRARHEQTGQHFLHFVIGAGLGQCLDTKSDGVFLTFAESPLVQCEDPSVLLPGQIGENSRQARHL